jgi:hypothetical protein
VSAGDTHEERPASTLEERIHFPELYEDESVGRGQS